VARAPRGELSDGEGTFHVTARGVAGIEIFTDDVDRRVFMQMLDRVAARNRWRLHAYCLMPNHFHLVVQTTPAALSRGMSRLNGGYAQYFNRRHERYGHLFQGRFGATVVDDMRRRDVRHYVLENPERAGLGRDYPWAAILIPD
jgi:REP element-mobilizing transposase RayT